MNRPTTLVERDNFSKNLLNSLLLSLKENNTEFSNYRDLLRNLENSLSEIILNDTNKKITKLLNNLFDDNLKDDIVEIEGKPKGFKSKDVSVISKTPLSKSAFARKITECLKSEGFQHYSKKDPKKIRFDETIRKFLSQKKINLTYFPPNFNIPEDLKANLFKFSDQPIRGSLVHNYKTLILHL